PIKPSKRREPANAIWGKEGLDGNQLLTLGGVACGIGDWVSASHRGGTKDGDNIRADDRGIGILVVRDGTALSREMSDVGSSRRYAARRHGDRSWTRNDRRLLIGRANETDGIEYGALHPADVVNESKAAEPGIGLNSECIRQPLPLSWSTYRSDRDVI